MKENKDSLISRFYGLHEVVWQDSDRNENKKYLVIMNNVFIDFDVGIRFDLKGSIQGRTSLKKGENLTNLTPK